VSLAANALIYLPLLIWLRHARRNRIAERSGNTHVLALRGMADLIAALQDMARQPNILRMCLLAAGASMFVGSAYQAQMPEFTRDLGHGDPSLTYSLLLGADAGGALSAGIALETLRFLQPSPRTAVILALGWAAALLGFALTSLYSVALGLLFAAGFLELSYNSMAQALVQLEAPAAARGRMIGVFSSASMGMRTISGVSVGLAGQYVGIHCSLAVSAALIIALCCALLYSARR
jgi:hypothetical protein